MSRLAVRIAAFAVLLPLCPVSHAYNLYGPYPWGEDTYHLKWGDIFTPGTSGGTITWSLIPDGTTFDPSSPDTYISGTSSLNALMNSLGHAQALAAIERCFARYSAKANIYFEQVPDSGVPLASLGSTPPGVGHIRIGAYSITGGGGAVGFAPPPNGGRVDGDIVLNSNSTFFFDNGAEGELIDVFNDFESLLMHEIAHAVGVAHSDTQSVTSQDFNIFKFVNRELDPDDIAAVQFLYGPALAADYNHDNQVNEADLAVWRTGYGNTTATQLDGDGNFDGAVDGADLLVWQREQGLGGPAATANMAPVPEPAALLLVALLGAIACVAANRRRAGAALEVF